MQRDLHILFSIAQWVDEGNRKTYKVIRQLAQSEENYQLIIREIERVRDQCVNSRKRGTQATLTVVEWLTILVDANWQCVYCRERPFQVMHHMLPLPEGGTVAENCVPACYRCSHFFHGALETKNGVRPWFLR